MVALIAKVTDLNGAVRGVLKRALQVDGVIRGLHEAESVQHTDIVQL